MDTQNAQIDAALAQVNAERAPGGAMSSQPMPGGAQPNNGNQAGQIIPIQPAVGGQ